MDFCGFTNLRTQMSQFKKNVGNLLVFVLFRLKTEDLVVKVWDLRNVSLANSEGNSQLFQFNIFCLGLAPQKG